MRKPSPLFSVVLVALLAAGGYLLVQNRRAAEALRVLQAQEETARNRYGQAIEEIAAIQDSLNAIALSDSGSAMRTSAIAAERRMSPTRGDEALARIAELRAGIDRARDRIAQLETRLRTSGTRVTGLERMVARLRQGLAEKEEMVGQLAGRVDSLQTHVTGLTETVRQTETRIAAQDSTLEERRREIGTIYYVIGTRRDLLDRGVVVARGGVLGIGKTLDPSGKVDPESFRTVDTDQQTVLPIPAARARVLTAQPPGSYTLELVNGQLELRILDVREFRKVRHLVILTA